MSKKIVKALKQAFNIEAARILKWIKSPYEAQEEMSLKEDEAIDLFNSNHKLKANRLLG